MENLEIIHLCWLHFIYLLPGHVIDRFHEIHPMRKCLGVFFMRQNWKKSPVSQRLWAQQEVSQPEIGREKEREGGS